MSFKIILQAISISTFLSLLSMIRILNVSGNETFPINVKYYNTNDLEILFKEIEHKFSGLAKLHTIGYSIQGRKLLALQISKNVGRRELLKPMFKYIGNMHGDETVGRQLIIYLAEYLLSNYNSDPRVTKLVDTIDIYLMPSMNPDGFEMASEGRCSSLNNYVGRNNAYGQDLNRDFPDQFIDKDNFSFRARQKETRCIMKWILSNPFVLSANLHGGAVVGSYPYDDSDSGRDCCRDSVSPDHNLVKHLASVYAQANPIMKGGEACRPDKFIGGITNGANWYELKGGMQDFNYVYSNCIEITFELSCCKYPIASTLPLHWNHNKDSLLKFMEQVHNGVKGIVRDDEHNLIAGASVKIYGKVIKTSKRGEYWKLLLPGNYSIQVTAKGYVSSLNNLVTIQENMTTIFNITLKEDKRTYLKPNVINYQYQDDFLIQTKYQHHNNENLEIFLRNIVKNYPSITLMKSIGQSVKGHYLWVLEISANPGEHITGKPSIKYVGNMHGNEVVGREILLLFAKFLCENYLIDEQVTRIVNTTRIHLLPSMNPDGYDMAKPEEINNVVGRNNAHNIDLNRNFPDQYRSLLNVKPEPETEAVMAWTLSERFVLSANLHNGALVANYPFDENPSNIILQKVANPSPDDDVFQHLARIYSNAHRKMHLGQPCAEHPKEHFLNGITNGAAWYSVSGSMQDWNYVEADCFEITLELGCVKYPGAEALPELWLDNKMALLDYIELAHIGVRGFVHSSIGNPISSAEVLVKGRKHITKTGSKGEYHRLLLPGSYNITVSSYGYESQTVQIIVPDVKPYSVGYNFTLMRDDPQHWSSAYDFRLIQHVVNTRYRTTNEIANYMAYLGNKYPNIAEFRTEYDDTSMLLHSLKITDQIGSSEEKKFHLLFLGGFFGSEGVGSEMVLNTAEHLMAAFEIGEHKHIQILRNAVVHVIPVLDDNFDSIIQNYRLHEDVCNPESFKQEFGERMIASNADKLVTAFKKLLWFGRYDFILNFGSGGCGLSYPRVNDSGFIYDKLLNNMHNLINSTTSHETCCNNQGNQNHAEITERLTNLMYNEYNVPIVTVRNSCCKMPRQEQLANVWRNSLKPLMSFLELIETGIQGAILGNTMNPLRHAVVTLKQFNRTFNVTRNLAYYKIMLPVGAYNVTFSANGFVNKKLLLKVKKGKLLYTDIVLESIDTARHSEVTLELVQENSRSIDVNVTDNISGKIIVLYFVCFITLFLLSITIFPKFAKF